MTTPTTTLQCHLVAIGASLAERDWTGERTAAQAWAECPRPDWMLADLIADKPDQRPAAVLLMVEQIRSRTLPRVRPEHREVCERALDAAEEWAHKHSGANRRAAKAAAATVKSAAIVYSYESTEAAWATAYAVVSPHPDIVFAYCVEQAVKAAVSAAWSASPQHCSVREYAVMSRISEAAAWCAAIRARWPEPPWSEA